MFVSSVLFLLFTITTAECYWTPAPLTNWTWQLSGPVDITKNVQVYDIDVWDVPATTITKLKQAGKKVICYFR
jgi:hypothetical protein